MANLKLRLDARAWPYRVLAENSGVAEQTIKQVMRGENSPNIETVIALARGLECHAWELLSDGSAPTAMPVSDGPIFAEVAALVTAYGKAEPLRRATAMVILTDDMRHLDAFPEDVHRVSEKLKGL